MRHILTVIVPDASTFEAYWYGIGTVLSIVETAPSRWLSYTVDYGEDAYRAQYQCDRFASGLYFGTVEASA